MEDEIEMPPLSPAPPIVVIPDEVPIPPEIPIPPRNVRYVVFDETGRILKSGDAPEGLVPLQPTATTAAIIIDDDMPMDVWDTHYIGVTGEDLDVLERPQLDIDDIVIPFGGTVDRTLPAGTTVKVEGNTEVLVDGSLHIEGELDGTYELTFSLFPYRDKVITVTVNAD